jgi:hypothetical protein
LYVGATAGGDDAAANDASIAWADLMLTGAASGSVYAWRVAGDDPSASLAPIAMFTHPYVALVNSRAAMTRAVAWEAPGTCLAVKSHLA